jgi:hypothetical protein
MDYTEARLERRTLKQKLFQIRLFIEGDLEELTNELQDLKDQYEASDGFTTWSDFPDKWDIGDPNGVKRGSFAFNDVDKRNFKRIDGVPYDTIVHLETPDGTNVGEEDSLTKDEEVVEEEVTVSDQMVQAKVSKLVKPVEEEIRH